MEEIRQYILSVLSAAVITSLIVRFIGKQEAVAGIVRMISSVFLVITVISPVIKLQIKDVSQYVSALEEDGKDIIYEAKSQAESETQSIISDKVETYIEDKAASYGAVITATVGITEPDSLKPDTIAIEGEVSPYIKKILQEAITDDLGIREDRQIWK